MDALAASVAETPPISSDLAAIKAIPDRFFNRELSWLTFNQRVLEEARRMEYPLLERLRFLSISGNNLDEFLMVRVAGLAGQVRRHNAEVSIDGLTPPRQLAAIRDEVMRLEAMQQEIWLELREALEGEGIHVVGDRGGRSLDPVQSRWLKDYFLDRILPVITPQAIDPAHPFPFVTNGGMGVMMSLTRIADGAQVMEMVLIPAALPRYVRIPGDDEAAYVSIADVIWLNAESLFPGFQVLGHGVFRVLRDSDIEIEEDAEDLVRYFPHRDPAPPPGQRHHAPASGRFPARGRAIAARSIAAGSCDHHPQPRPHRHGGPVGHRR